MNREKKGYEREKERESKRERERDKQREKERQTERKRERENPLPFNSYCSYTTPVVMKVKFLGIGERKANGGFWEKLYFQVYATTRVFMHFCDISQILGTA